MYICFVEGAQWRFDVKIFTMTREDCITKRSQRSCSDDCLNLFKFQVCTNEYNAIFQASVMRPVDILNAK